MSKRRCLGIKEKLKVLEDVDSGIKKKDVAIKYGIPANSLSTIIKNRESIFKQSEVLADCNTARKRIKSCLYEDVDEAVLKWISLVRDKNVPLSGTIIKEKAIEYAKSLGLTEFNASNGWLDKFKKRHAIKEKVICGESADVSDQDCHLWQHGVLKKVLKDYTPDNIFNADETALFFKCLPNKTLTFKNDNCFGGKHSKDRITVMVASNMTGKEKLKLLVIGKSQKPRCFRGIKSLEVEYDFNKKSWMTALIFKKWILNLDKRMGKERRKIVMFVDNCPAHPKSIENLKNIRLVFFPPNTTSKLQPMDQGVIKNLKCHYRRRILKKIINAIDNNQPVIESINLRDCISELSKAWHDVNETTIKNCFSKAGFKNTPSASDCEEELPLSELKETWGKLKEYGTICEDAKLEEYLEIDNNMCIAELPNDDDILESVRNNNEVEKVDDEENEEVENECVLKPSHNDMINAFETIRHGFQFQENVPDDIFNSLHRCESFFEKNESASKVQQKITDYFSA